MEELQSPNQDIFDLGLQNLTVQGLSKTRKRAEKERKRGDHTKVATVCV